MAITPFKKVKKHVSLAVDRSSIWSAGCRDREKWRLSASTRVVGACTGICSRASRSHRLSASPPNGARSDEMRGLPAASGNRMTPICQPEQALVANRCHTPLRRCHAPDHFSDRPEFSSSSVFHTVGRKALYRLIGDDCNDIVDWGNAHFTLLRGFAKFHFCIPCVDGCAAS